MFTDKKKIAVCLVVTQPCELLCFCSKIEHILLYRLDEVCCLYGRLVYHILSYSFGSRLNHCIYGCMLSMLLFNFVNYVLFCYVFVFLLLCVFRSFYSVSLCCSVYCLCVNVYCTTATGCQSKCS